MDAVLTTGLRGAASRSAMRCVLAATRSPVRQHVMTRSSGLGAIATAISTVPVSSIAANPIAVMANGLDVDSITNLIYNNPIAAGAGIGAVGLAGVVGSVFGNAKVTTVSPSDAYQLLCNEARVALLDIRAKAAKSGSPDLKEAGKKVLSLPYTKVVDEEEVVVEEFVEQFQASRSISEDALLVLLDADGSLAGRAAAALAAAEVPQPKLYVVKGGADAWQAAELPWKESPSFSLPSLSLPGLPERLEDLAESYKANPTLTNTALALGALVGSVTFIVNEFDILLELAGALGVGQLVYKNFLFADDRERTLGKLRAFLQNTGADSAGEELKNMARLILEKAEASASAAAAAAAAQATATPSAAPATGTAAAASSTSASAAQVPENVASARQWIANWRAKDAPAAASTTAGDAPQAAAAAAVPENVAEARQWIANWRAKGAAAAASAPLSARDDIVAENVASARVWISNWRARTSQQAAEAAIAAASAQVAAAVAGKPVKSDKKDVVYV